jgi:hypothetical protein
MKVTMLKKRASLKVLLQDSSGRVSSRGSWLWNQLSDTFLRMTRSLSGSAVG